MREECLELCLPQGRSLGGRPAEPKESIARNRFVLLSLQGACRTVGTTEEERLQEPACLCKRCVGRQCYFSGQRLKEKSQNFKGGENTELPRRVLPDVIGGRRGTKRHQKHGWSRFFGLRKTTLWAILLRREEGGRAAV